MIDIYICEDITEQKAFLSDFISDYCESQSLDAALVLASSSPSEILAHFHREENPALFFLDIDLKAQINGIELARQIREQAHANRKVFIVFLTIHAEMTLMTFEYKVEALDFILKDKPGTMKKKIRECIDISLARHVGGKNAKIVQIRANKKTIFLDMDEIICIETSHIRHKLRLYAKNRVIEFNGELKEIESRLDERFVRVYKSYLINRDKIASIDKQANTLTMINGSVCPISRRGKKLL